MCHSQWSSSRFPRAAPMPPWAVPVWERVGYSLLSTATFALPDISIAAIRPAPPPPTTTASNLWYIATPLWEPQNRYADPYQLSEPGWKDRMLCAPTTRKTKVTRYRVDRTTTRHPLEWR